MNKAYLISFTLYTSEEGEHNYEKTIRLVNVGMDENYDNALKKLKLEVKLTNNGEVQNPINLTI